ncbi:MAG: D-tyrosyl-tRNA(Tyr) deacylase [Balneolales bacterium]|nr:D-tyrosyl-tRNA(Tyr) deacylase [Balneolales bacterium]
MRTVVQRVSKASVTVDGKVVGQIGEGLLVLAGFHTSDTEEQMRWMCDKLLKLRIFNDDEGKMNRSVQDVGGSLLVVSQFTLYGDARKGTRPSFIESARPEVAIPLYESMLDYLRVNGNLPVESGEFGAMMEVSLVNDGPVTIILER